MEKGQQLPDAHPEHGCNIATATGQASGPEVGKPRAAEVSEKPASIACIVASEPTQNTSSRFANDSPFARPGKVFLRCRRSAASDSRAATT